MKKQWKIRPTKKSDAQAIFTVLLIGWLDTYINEEIGVTSDFILKRRLSSLEYKFYQDHCKYENFENSKHNLHYVAEDDKGIIVGLVHGNRTNGGQALEGLYIYKEFQGSGLAQDLADKFLEWEDKTLDSTVNVVEYNGRAIRFYEKLGFKDCGARNMFLDRIPCIDMVKNNVEDKQL